jgi:hypothetical protein
MVRSSNTSEGEIFRTGRGAQSASYPMGTDSLSRGVKQLREGVDSPPQSSAQVKEKVKLYLYSPRCLYGMF